MRTPSTGKAALALVLIELLTQLCAIISYWVANCEHQYMAAQVNGNQQLTSTADMSMGQNFFWVGTLLSIGSCAVTLPFEHPNLAKH